MILHDILVVQVLEQLDLVLERTQHAPLALLVRLRAGGQLDLLDGHEQPARGVQPEVHLPKGPCADERAFDPLDCFLCVRIEEVSVTLAMM